MNRHKIICPKANLYRVEGLLQNEVFVVCNCCSCLMRSTQRTFKFSKISGRRPRAVRPPVPSPTPTLSHPSPETTDLASTSFNLDTLFIFRSFVDCKALPSISFRPFNSSRHIFIIIIHRKKIVLDSI